MSCTGNGGLRSGGGLRSAPPPHGNAVPAPQIIPMRKVWVSIRKRLAAASHQANGSLWQHATSYSCKRDISIEAWDADRYWLSSLWSELEWRADSLHRVDI